MPDVIVWDNNPPTPPLQPALNITEFAALLKVCHKTARRMIADGDVPAVKVRGRWRVRTEDAAAFLAGDLP